MAKTKRIKPAARLILKSNQVHKDKRIKIESDRFRKKINSFLKKGSKYDTQD